MYPARMLSFTSPPISIETAALQGLLVPLALGLVEHLSCLLIRRRMLCAAIRSVYWFASFCYVCAVAEDSRLKLYGVHGAHDARVYAAVATPIAVTVFFGVLRATVRAWKRRQPAARGFPMLPIKA